MCVCVNRRRDLFVRDDGQLSTDKQTSDERKRSIEKTKVRDLSSNLQTSIEYEGYSTLSYRRKSVVTYENSIGKQTCGIVTSATTTNLSLIYEQRQ